MNPISVPGPIKEEEKESGGSRTPLWWGWRDVKKSFQSLNRRRKKGPPCPYVFLHISPDLLTHLQVLCHGIGKQRVKCLHIWNCSSWQTVSLPTVHVRGTWHCLQGAHCPLQSFYKILHVSHNVPPAETDQMSYVILILYYMRWGRCQIHRTG